MANRSHIHPGFLPSISNISIMMPARIKIMIELNNIKIDIPYRKIFRTLLSGFSYPVSLLTNKRLANTAAIAIWMPKKLSDSSSSSASNDLDS